MKTTTNSAPADLDQLFAAWVKATNDRSAMLNMGRSWIVRRANRRAADAKVAAAMAAYEAAKSAAL